MQVNNTSNSPWIGDKVSFNIDGDVTEGIIVDVSDIHYDMEKDSLFNIYTVRYEDTGGTFLTVSLDSHDLRSNDYES